MKIILIAAVSINGIIASTKDELVTWMSREDKLNFKTLTTKSSVVVMGMNTFKSFPSPLKDRLNIVLTKGQKQKDSLSNVMYFDPDLSDLVKFLKEKNYEEVYVIGGAITFTSFLNHRLIDYINITIEPIIFSNGINLFSSLTNNINLVIKEFKTLNENTINIIYKVNYI